MRLVDGATGTVAVGTTIFRAQGQHDVSLMAEGAFDGATVTLFWRVASSEWSEFQGGEGTLTAPGVLVLSLRRTLDEEILISCSITGGGAGQEIYVHAN